MLVYAYKTEIPEFRQAILDYASILQSVVISTGKYKQMINGDLKKQKLAYAKSILVKYLDLYINSKTPEWQILALRHGWRKVD